MIRSRIKSPEKVSLTNAPEVELLLRPSVRARRLSLRVSRLDGRVTLSMPTGTLRREALRFAEERADWIRSHLEDIPQDMRPALGDTIPFQGRDHRLIVGTGRTVQAGNGTISFPQAAQSNPAPRLMAFLKQHARARLDTASRHYASEIGYEFGKLTLRDTRSRWGSCSSDGNLMYSWRLIMAPPEVLDYVAAHEVSHLVHMDHSSAFWNQVEEIFPDYRAPRKWLRDNGANLHRYRFKD
ncbi:SprT family zinc-dependent metalloprotease [Aliiroseovarius sp. KMU-50]|uniref:SprT family zinc-dependent metalloprotease n=1 Tax=Aliiroseovarius salicola TaxID=3009082 RepID=A0ABT4W401_9RHOB|nr:SprT family zinc-dependent metalloprotease [Aliiroseovarius sp. KMU-50]MDA5095149.1 SprT family zinc-dependent metalloprotease [Aliiroseovarius sp. KMU-50]